MKMALLLAAALALPLHAAEPAAAQLAKDLEGAYKSGSANPDDTVEIVRHDDSRVFLRIALTGEKARHCSITGIAAFEGGAFVYHDPNQSLSGGQACTLTVSAKGDALQLTDRAGPKGPSTCSKQCGGRGGMGDYSIAMSKKSPMHASPKLKASKEYVQAVKAFEAAQQ
jgi:hypothetical protein